MEEQITAHGHELVTATHGSTFELTSDEYLTSAGDCILGIGANRTPADFDPAFIRACQDEEARITATMQAGAITTTVVGRGDPALTFESDRSLVGRTSDYIDERTVLLEADTAAADVDRSMVEVLSSGGALTCTLRVQS